MFDSLSRSPASPLSGDNEDITMGVCNVSVDPGEDSDDDIYTTQQNPGGISAEKPKVTDKCCKVISRNDPIYLKWQDVILTSVIISACLGVFMVTLDSTELTLWVVVYLCDALFVVDMILMFFTSYKGRGGIQVSKRNKIVRKYLRKLFIVDLLSVLPLEILAVVLDPDTLWMTVAFFRLNRLLRLYKIFTYFEKREDDLDQSTTVTRGLKYFVLSLLTTHVMTCGWYAIACDGHHDGVNITCQHQSWATTFDLGFDMSQAESSRAYTTCLYWAVATATSTGYGDIYATTIREKWYAIFGMLSGIGVFFGMLLGGMTSMLTNLDAHRSSYVHRFQSIKRNLREQSVKKELTDMVVSFYEYLWKEKKGVLSHGVYDQLPIVFQAEIAQATNSETIQKAPIFSDTDPGLIRMLSLSFKHVLCLPNQIIIKRGDIGTQMFFIHSGEVEVMHEEDDEAAVATLKTGKIFGEVSLVFSLPRTATVRAKTHCDLMVLEKTDLQRILRHFPNASDALQAQAKKRLQVLNEITAAKKPKPQKDAAAMLNQPQWLRRSSFMPTKSMLTQVTAVKAPPKVKLSKSVEILNDADKDSTSSKASKDKGSRSCKVCSDRCSCLVVSKSSMSYKVWKHVMLVIIIVNMFLHPYMAAFPAYQPRAGYGDSTPGVIFFMFITYLFDVATIADIIVDYLANPLDSSLSMKEKVKARLTSASLWTDLLSVIPLELLAFATTGSMDEKWRLFALLRLNRLLRIYSLLSVFNHLEDSLHVTVSLVRSVRLVFYIVLLSHWAACIVFIMACYGSTCDSESWIEERRQSAEISSPVSEYITSMYWVVATMTSTGYGDINANTTVGRVISLLLMLVGLLLYGYCLALMAATLANADSPRVQFQEKLFAVKSYLQEQHVNIGLQHQVIKYMNLLWDKYGGIWMPGEEPILHDVPQVLQEDISFDTVANKLEKVPLFSATDDSFLRSLSLRRTTYLFSPGDVIIYAGDVGREMYLIEDGWCQVMPPDCSYILSVIGPGEFVGEAGLVFPESRTVTVVAKTHCVLDMLTIDDLRHTLGDFQLLRDQFHEAEKQRCSLIELQRTHLEGLRRRLSSLDNESSVSSIKSVLGRSSSMDQTSVMSFKKTVAGNVPNKDYLAPFQNLHFFSKLFTHLLMRRTFHPDGRLLKGWTMLMVVVSIITSFSVTLQASFLHDSTLMWIIAFILDIIGLISLYLSFHVAFYNDDNILVTHPLSTARQYLKTNFLLDFLSVFPFEIFAFAAHPNFNYESLYLFSMVRLTRLIQLYRLPMAFTYLESSIDKETGMLRQIKFAFYSVIFLNWLTCSFFVMACPPNLSDNSDMYITLSGSGQHCLADSWLVRTISSVEVKTSTLYTACLYWAAATSVSVGYGDISAYKDEEMVIALIAMVAGVLFFGYIIASVAASLANADAQRARFQEKLNAVNNFLRSEKLESALQERIIHYYDYVWLRTRGVDPNSLFNFLPLALWGDVTLDLYEDTLKGISLFKDAETSFLKMLSRTIRPILFLKGEYVVRKFDMGQEMYFIKRGAVEVVSEDGKMVFATMRAGDSFGEVALLFSVPRTASIRAGTNADLFYLTKSDLDHVLNLYPKVKETVLQIGEERRQQARQRSQAKAQAKSISKAKLASKLSVQAKSTIDQLSSQVVSVEEGKDDVKVRQGVTLASAGAVGFVPSVVINGKEYPITDVNEEDVYSPPSDPVEALHDEEWEATVPDTDMELYDSDEEEINANNANNINQHNNEDDEQVEEKVERCAWMKKLGALNRFTISPRSKLLGYYNTWICFLGFISVWILTYQAAYQDQSLALIIIGFIFDAFFIVDIYIHFHTSSFDMYGDLTENFEDVYKSYLKRASGFPVDLVAALPLDIFALAAPSGKKLTALFFLRLIHCLRLLRVSSYFSRWEKGLNINMLTARLTKFFVGLVLLIHFLSCIWYTLACPLAECKAASWVQLKVSVVNTALNSYCVCVYWTVATMTSTGYGDIYATTDLEMLFASIVMVAGKLMFGFILGNIASTLSNEEIPKVKYQEKLGVLKLAMNDQSVPSSVKHIVIDYMVNLWFHNKGIEPDTLFTDTPPCLKAELFRKISAPMFDTITMLQGADESFLRALSIRVKQQIFIPGNYIMRKGDVGQEVYYIHKGEVHVWVDGEPVEVLKSGEVFGEVSLLSPVSRQVDVSARTHVVLLSLSMEDFDDILMDFPTVAAHVHEVGYERFKSILKPDYARNKRYFNNYSDISL